MTRRLLVSLLLLGVAGSAGAEGWTAPSATTVVRLSDDVLRSLGVRVVRAVATAENPGFPGHAFATSPPSELRFRAPGGDFERFDSGSLVHRGGLVLALPGETGLLSLEGFRLRVAPAPDDFDWLDASGRRHFVLRHMQFTSSLARQRLELRNVSVHLAPELADRLDRPDLAGTWVGEANVVLPALLPDSAGGAGAGGVCEEVDGPIDVELTGIAYLSQVVREPGGRVAISPSATLANVGEGSVEWYESIEPAFFDGVGPHPFLSMAFYRLDPDGTLLQLGLGDVKHAFRSLNTGCPCPSAPILYPGCADTYGVTTNQERLYLGPRDEVDPRTGAWERVGSHFDRCLARGEVDCDAGVDDADDYRDHGGDRSGSLYHDAFEHRLVVSEADLQVAGARYFVEAWYVVAGDVNLENSLGYREVAPTLIGEMWSFPFLDEGLRHGSVIGELPGALATAPLSVAALPPEDLGDGRHRYGFAFLNYRHPEGPLARLVARVPAEATVESVDSQGLGGPWTVVVRDDAVEWSAPAGDELAWGRLVTVGFESNAAPGVGRVRAVPSEAGAAEVELVLPHGPVPVPEPAGAALAVASLAALGCARRYARPS